MTVGELSRRLKTRTHTVTGRHPRAVQEMRRVAGPGIDIFFQSGAELDERGAASGWALSTMGWNQERGDDNPVFMVVVW